MVIRSKRYSTMAAAMAVLMVLAVSLLAATTAHGEESPLRWYAEGTELTKEETATVESVGTTSIETHLSGTKILLSATGVEAVGLKFSNEFSQAHGSGYLRFTGVHLESPSNCTTSSTLLSKALSFTVEHADGRAYLVAKPVAGEESNLFLFELTGPTCALKTTLTMKGHIRGRFQNLPGTMAVKQGVNFAPAYMPYGSLHRGTEDVSFTSEMFFSLSGKAFGLN